MKYRNQNLETDVALYTAYSAWLDSFHVIQRRSQPLRCSIYKEVTFTESFIRLRHTSRLFLSLRRHESLYRLSLPCPDLHHWTHQWRYNDATSNRYTYYRHEITHL